MTRTDLAEIIERAKTHGLEHVILVVTKGPKWRHRSWQSRTALGLGRVVGTQNRKDGKPGTDVLVEYRVNHLEAFLAKWKRMAGDE